MLSTDPEEAAWERLRAALIRANIGPQVALLDCNAWNYLVRPPRQMAIDPAKAVAQLEAAVDGGRLICLATSRLIGQIGGTGRRDPDKMHRMFRLLRRLSREYVFDSGPDCLRAERLAGGRLDFTELCLCPQDSAATWERLDGPIEREPGIVRHIHKLARDGAEEAAICASEVEEFRAIAGGKGRANANLDEEHADRDAGVAQCYETFVRQFRAEYGDDGLPWPPVEQMPSMWSYGAFLISRLQLVNTRRISPDDGDEGDAMLYADAAYADVLVTDDANLRRIVANIGPRALPTMTLEKFVAVWS